jgi:hypothetical protein
MTIECVLTKLTKSNKVLAASNRILAESNAALTISSQQLATEIANLRKAIGLRISGLVTAQMIEEGIGNAMSMSKFALNLPPLGAIDVVKRELVFTVTAPDGR